MAKTIAKLQAQARKTSSKAPTRNKASGTKSAAREIESKDQGAPEADLQRQPFPRRRLPGRRPAQLR